MGLYHTKEINCKQEFQIHIGLFLSQIKKTLKMTASPITHTVFQFFESKTTYTTYTTNTTLRAGTHEGSWGCMSCIGCLLFI